jgi:hypothetical protein
MPDASQRRTRNCRVAVCMPLMDGTPVSREVSFRSAEARSRVCPRRDRYRCGGPCSGRPHAEDAQIPGRYLGEMRT